jgi:hypothetical protein
MNESRRPPMNSSVAGSGLQELIAMKMAGLVIGTGIVVLFSVVAEGQGSFGHAAAGDSGWKAVEAASVQLAAAASGGCAQGGVSAVPTRPSWTGGAATTQCGVLETDYGWLLQTMGGDVDQAIAGASARYGLTERADFRWAAPGRIAQRSGGARLNGITDQWMSIRYRFYDQGRRAPALGLSYGVKIPSANPRKGFGSGFVDHQLVVIASRDLGRVHVDFNAAGTIAGPARGHDGAVQAGMALALPVTRKFVCVLDNYGGSQVGIADRYGAALLGGSWTLRSWLVLDGAYGRAYTAGAPRQQIAAGFTYAMRAGGGLSRRSRMGRLMAER